MTGLTLEPLGAHGAVYGPAGGATGLPAVVVLHGGEGPMAGWSHRFAAILAAHGFLALPLGYGTGDFFAAGPIRAVDLAAVPAAGRALAAHPRAARVGLFGWSKGGEAALLAASLDPDTPFAAVAAHAAPDRVTGAFDPDALRRGDRWLLDAPTDPRAWVWQGRDAPLAPGTAIPVEAAPMPLFLSVGTADEIWPAAQTLGMAERLAAAGRPAELLVGEGQGHAYDFTTEPQLWARLCGFFGQHLGHG